MHKECSVSGCKTKASTRGMCRKHYCQVWKFGKIIPEKPFVNLPNEEWRDIEGYNGKYQVSNFGRVRSFSNNKWGSKNNPSITKSGVSTTGYEVVILSKDGHRKTKKVHRLVAQAFIPNPENKGDVNHKDGNKTNNNAYNLEWMTRQENIRHSIDVLGFSPGYWMERAVICVETGKKYCSAAQAGRELGIDRNAISRAASENPKYRYRKTAGGLHWKFAD